MQPGQPKGVPEDFVPRTIEFARRALDDIPSMRRASYSIRWIDQRPLLVIAFDELARGGGETPCLGIGLVPVNKGTLLDAYPGNELFRGEKLKRHLLESVGHYLTKIGEGLGLQLSA